VAAQQADSRRRKAAFPVGAAIFDLLALKTLRARKECRCGHTELATVQAAEMQEYTVRMALVSRASRQGSMVQASHHLLPFCCVCGSDSILPPAKRTRTRRVIPRIRQGIHREREAINHAKSSQRPDPDQDELADGHTHLEEPPRSASRWTGWAAGILSDPAGRGRRRRRRRW